MTIQQKLEKMRDAKSGSARVEKFLDDISMARAVNKLNIKKGEPGAPGKTPVKGVDYLTPKEVRDISDQIRANIKEEITPKKGKDYYTDSEIQFIINYIQSRVPNGSDGTAGKNGLNGRTPIRGVDYWTPADQEMILRSTLSRIPRPVNVPKTEDIVNRVVDEIKKKKVEFKDIKGTEQLIEFLKLGGFRGGGGSSNAVISVSGTANRITSSGGTTPIIDISSSYVGQTSITTLGTISTGVWNGTTIAIANGGTGQTTANAALNALLPSQAGNSGKFLTTDGNNTSWGSAGASGITIGTTTITSGTTTRILYNNAGVVGEYTLTGTGTVAVMQTSPTLVTPVLGVATYTTLSGGNITDSALTAGRVVFAGTAGLLVDDADMTFSGTRLTITDLTVTNTIVGSITGNATTVTTNANLTGVITSSGNATSIASQTGTGTKFVVDTSPTLVTPVLGVATATSINKVAITAPATSATLTIADGKTATHNASTTFAGTDGKTLTISNSITLAGTDSTVMTFPTTSATIARTDAAQTFTGTQTFSQVIATANAIAASSNAATVPVTSKNNIVTNSSAATLTITLTTTSAVNMQDCIVQILDFSAVAQTLVFVNTENSTVSVPATSNGSTTLPLTVGFKYNSATSLWRCVAKA